MSRNILPVLLALLLMGNLAPVASGQSAKNRTSTEATQDLSHVYGTNYREIIEKYGDRPDILSQKAAEYRLSKEVTSRLNLGRLAKGASMTEDWILRSEAEPNNDFAGADNINDVLATAGWKKDGDGSSEFTGGQVSASLSDGDFDISERPGHKAEFSAWRWAPIAEAVEQVVPFKRPVYEQVARAFAGICR